MESKLSRINKECTEQGKTYADWQKQMYPINTGLNKNNNTQDDINNKNIITEQKRHINMLIHPQYEKTHLKVSLTRNAQALLNK